MTAFWLQIREAKARRDKLKTQEKEWVSQQSAKKVAGDTIQYLKVRPISTSYCLGQVKPGGRCRTRV
jgi:hypothetical protein